MNKWPGASFLGSFHPSGAQNMTAGCTDFESCASGVCKLF